MGYRTSAATKKWLSDNNVKQYFSNLLHDDKYGHSSGGYNGILGGDAGKLLNLEYLTTMPGYKDPVGAVWSALGGQDDTLYDITMSDIFWAVDHGHLSAYQKNIGSSNFDDYSKEGINIPKAVWNDYAEYIISHQSDFSTSQVQEAQKYITGKDPLTEEERKRMAAGVVTNVNGKPVQQIINEKLKGCLDSISEMVNTGSHYTPFVVLNLAGMEMVGDKKTKTVDITIDTRKNTNSISSYFKYERNGSGQANQFTIAVIFSPHERAKSLLDSENNIDPNTLETVLTQICFAKLDKNAEELSDEKILESMSNTLWSCKLKVGYVVDGKESIESPEYDTMITDYSCEFRDNTLYYTINGVSTIMQAKTYTKFTRPHFACTEEPITSAVNEVLLKNIDLDKFCITPGTLPNGELIFTKLKKGQVSKNSPDSVIDCKCTRNFRDYAQYKLKLAENGSTDENTPTDSEDALNKMIDEGIPKATSEEPLIYVANYLLQYAILNDNYMKSYKGKFNFSILDSTKLVDSSGTAKSIIFVQFEDQHKDFSSVDKINSIYSFQWLDTPTPASLVKDFKIDASGAYIKAAINTNTTALLEQLYAVNNEGEAFKLSDTDSVINESGEYASWYKILKERVYKEALMKLGNYEATLTTVGIPAEIPILTTFEINVYMNGTKHFSSGHYRVTSIEDILDTGGYITTLKLLKLTENIDVEELAKKLKVLVKSLYKDVDIVTTTQIGDTDKYVKLVTKNKNSKLYKYWKQQYDHYKQTYRGAPGEVQDFETFIKKSGANSRVPMSDNDITYGVGSSTSKTLYVNKNNPTESKYKAKPSLKKVKKRKNTKKKKSK